MSSQWDEWMRLTLTGDKEAYKQLLTALRPWLKAFYSKRVPSAAIEDLVQETMMTLHEKRHTYDATQPFMPWLATVAKHRWVDYMRKVYRRMETSLDDDIGIPVFDNDLTVNRDVMRLLEQIPAAQAEVIDLVKLREMSIEQAARKTGHSASSVKVMIHRGLKRLSALAREENSDEH